MPVSMEGAGLGAPGVTPGIRTTTTTERGAPLPTEQIAAMKKANAEIAKNTESIVQSQIDTDLKIDAAFNDYRAVQDAMALKEADLQARKQAAAQESLNRLDALREQRRSLSVRPEGMFEGSTGKQILSGIALAMGALSQAYTGAQTNPAYDVMQKAIDREIQLQKASVDKIGVDIADENNYYAQAMKMYGNEADALTAARASRLEDIKMQMTRYASALTSKERQVAAMNEIQKVEAMQAAEIAKLQQSSAAKVQTQTVIDVPSTAPSARDSKEQREIEKDERERLVPGYGLALSKEDATGLRQRSSDVEQVAASLDQLKKYVGVSLTDRKKIAAAKQDVQALVGKLRLELVGPGAMTDSERTFIQDLIGDPTKIFALDSATSQRFENLSQKVRKNLNIEMQQKGVQPIAGMANRNYRADSFQGRQ